MKINVEFNSTEEMKDFCKLVQVEAVSCTQLCVQKEVTKTGTKTIQVPNVETEPDIDRDKVKDEATELGIKFRSDISTVTLQARIDSNKADTKKVEALEEVIDDNSTSEEDLKELDALLNEKEKESSDVNVEAVEETETIGTEENEKVKEEDEKEEEDVPKVTEKAKEEITEPVEEKPSRRNRRRDKRKAVPWKSKAS
jgi:hypothetical protein